MNRCHLPQCPAIAAPRLPRQMRGVTLIEVLISLLILSLALIGIAGLQAFTTSYQQGVFTRSSLSTHLNDLTGRMRANLTEVPGFKPGVPPESAIYRLVDTWEAQQDELDDPGKLCGIESSAGVCTAAERATYDVWAWRKQIRESMPQGSAQISGSIHQGITVTFMWFDKDNTAGENYALREAATCEADADLEGNTMGEATMERQTCCPEAAAVPDGVRCANFTVVP